MNPFTYELKLDTHRDPVPFTGEKALKVIQAVYAGEKNLSVYIADIYDKDGGKWGHRHGVRDSQLEQLLESFKGNELALVVKIGKEWAEKVESPKTQAMDSDNQRFWLERKHFCYDEFLEGYDGNLPQLSIARRMIPSEKSRRGGILTLRLAAYSKDGIDNATNKIKDVLGLGNLYANLDERTKELLDRTIGSLEDISVRANNALRSQYTVYVGQLVRYTRADLLRIPNFGKKSLSEVEEALKSMGLRLGMNIDFEPPEDPDIIS